MQYGIAFTPLVPSLVLWLAALAIVVIAGLLLLGRARGTAVRVTALALILLALANPSFTREDREPLSSVAAVVIDKSPSQNFGERNRESAGGAGRQPQKDCGIRGAGGGGRTGRRRNRRHQIVRRAGLGIVGCSRRARRRRLPDHRRAGARHSCERGGARLSSPGARADHRTQGRTRP